MMEVLVLIFGLLGVVLVAMLARRPMRRLLRQTPRTDIAQATGEQLTKFAGKVTFGETTLHAPLTGTPCVCYSLTIEGVDSENGGRPIDVNEGIPFWLNDGNTSINVHPLHFRIVPGGIAVTTLITQPNADSLDALHRSLERAADNGQHQAALGLLRRGWSLRVREAIVSEGTTVAIHGYVEKRTDPTGAATMRITCPNDGPLLISDDPSTFS